MHLQVDFNACEFNTLFLWPICPSLQKESGLAIIGRGLYYSTIIVESGWSEPCQHAKLSAKLWLRKLLITLVICVIRHTGKEESFQLADLAQEVARFLAQVQMKTTVQDQAIPGSLCANHPWDRIPDCHSTFYLRVFAACIVTPDTSRIGFAVRWLRFSEL